MNAEGWRVMANEQCSDETVHELKGDPLVYAASGSVLSPDRTDQGLSRAQSEKAWYGRAMREMRGPSYLNATLTDQRIAGPCHSSALSSP